MPVIWVSHGDTSGYGVAGAAYVRALLDAGVDVVWRTLDSSGRAQATPPSRLTTDPALLAAHRRSDAGAGVAVLQTYAERLPALAAEHRASGRAVLGATVWELPRIPASWPDALAAVDAVIVPTTANRDAILAEGLRLPVHVVPHLPRAATPVTEGANRRLLARLRPETRSAIERGAVVVYTIGLFGRRKGLDAAVLAYRRATSAPLDSRAPGTVLLVKTGTRDATGDGIARVGLPLRRDGLRLRRSVHHPSPVDAVARLSAQVPGGGPVAVIADDTLPDDEIEALHGLGDVYLSLARAEGWGLGAFDAACRARPVVATRIGGHLDFLDDDGAWLVSHTPAPAHDPVWAVDYRPEDRWAEPDLDHAATHLRTVLADLPAARERARGLAARCATRFDPDRITRDLVAAIHDTEAAR